MSSVQALPYIQRARLDRVSSVQALLYIKRARLDSVSSVQALLNIYFLPIYESASISKKAIWLQCKILKLRMISSTYFCHYNSGNFSLIPQILQKTATFLESQLLEIIKRATII